MAEFRLLIIALVASVLWGASVLADLPSGNDTLDQQRTSINSKVGYLNSTTPDLNLRTRVSASDIAVANQILGDLNSLYFALIGEQTVAPHSLTTLTCSRPLCYGDDDGGGE